MHGSPERLAETVRAADVVVVRWGSPRDTTDQAVRGRRCIVPWNQDGLFVRRGELVIGPGAGNPGLAGERGEQARLS